MFYGFAEILSRCLECLATIVEELFEGSVFGMKVCEGEIDREVAVSLIYKVVW